MLYSGDPDRRHHLGVAARAVDAHSWRCQLPGRGSQRHRRDLSLAKMLVYSVVRSAVKATRLGHVG